MKNLFKLLPSLLVVATSAIAVSPPQKLTVQVRHHTPGCKGCKVQINLPLELSLPTLILPEVGHTGVNDFYVNYKHTPINSGEINAKLLSANNTLLYEASYSQSINMNDFYGLVVDVAGEKITKITPTNDYMGKVPAREGNYTKGHSRNMGTIVAVTEVVKTSPLVVSPVVPEPVVTEVVTEVPVTVDTARAA